MKQLTKAFLIIILSIGQLSSCSYFAPFKVAVLQGNIIEDKDVEPRSYLNGIMFLPDGETGN